LSIIVSILLIKSWVFAIGHGMYSVMQFKNDDHHMKELISILSCSGKLAVGFITAVAAACITNNERRRMKSDIAESHALALLYF
jgi:hypothetical protein